MKPRKIWFIGVLLPVISGCPHQPSNPPALTPPGNPGVSGETSYPTSNGNAPLKLNNTSPLGSSNSQKAPALIPNINRDRGITAMKPSPSGGGGGGTVGGGGEIPVSGTAHLTSDTNIIYVRDVPNGSVISQFTLGLGTYSISLSGVSTKMGDRTWYQLASGGWVEGNNLVVATATVQGAPTQGIPIYKYPDPVRSTVVGWLLNGDTVQVTGTKTEVGDRTWNDVRVEKPRKAVGWVDGTYLSIN